MAEVLITENAETNEDLDKIEISIIPSTKEYITALEIDSSQKSIDNTIEERLKEFNKKRYRKLVKEKRDLRRVELNDSSFLLSKVEMDEIRASLVNDDIAISFRENEHKNIESQRNNFFEVRQTLNDLNDMNEYSAEIERQNIQSISNFLKFRDLITHSASCNSILFKMKETRQQSINEFVSNFKFVDELDQYDDPLSLIISMRKLYAVRRDMDDIDFYENYGLESNIDLSRKLAYQYITRAKHGNSYSNIINEFVPSNSNNPIEQLTKRQIVSNKMLSMLLLPADKNQAFISTNQVSCLKTTYTTTDTNELIYSTRTLGELLLEITNEDYGLVEKSAKQQIYSSYDGTRPKKEEYYKWNGLQVYDIDLKEWDGNIDLLKSGLHDILVDFHWYLWICKSASGKGIHIYTKVSPPHHVYLHPKDNEYICRYWYNVNYATKLANIYDALDRLSKNPQSPIKFLNEFENKFVDNVVRRITAGIRLTYDPKPLVNHNFIDLHPGVGLSQTIDGFSSYTTLERILFRETEFNKKFIEFFDTELAVESAEAYEANKTPKVDLSKYVNIVGDMGTITALPRNSIKYNVRYNVCNTLAALFGKDGLAMAHTLLDSKGCKNVDEINSFYSCALSNRKEPSKLGIEILEKAGVIKNVKPEITKQIDNNFKTELKEQIEKSLSNTLAKIDFNLGPNQFLSDIKEQIFDEISGEKITMILSPPNTGKTEMIKRTAKEGKRVLLVLPYISVIKNKIETDQDITENFDTFYGSRDIKDLEYGRNAVTTFDKFSRSNYEKLSKMFDYIFIDESHLLFTSSYRIEATSNAIKKLKDLFYISSNDPFAAKIVLMTGTETGESYFFNTVGKIIRVSKNKLEKKMEFLICDDNLDATTRLSTKVATLINKGYKIMIPTNNGEIYSEKIIGMVEFLLQRSVKYGYYKRSNTEQEICQMINNNNTVGDYDIIFCSNYLSVGVDINDKFKFASVYLGNFSGYEIEQFNARVRKSSIESIYCITTTQSDGSINNVLLEEPNLVLRITDEEQLDFIDDKAIAGVKTEFMACYDPILHKIQTPGFSILNGKIQFNLEEYELLSFENKYSECMQHPIKVARELSKYGYTITVSTEFEGLEITQQAELKKMGLLAAKEEKIRKHDLMVGTFIELVKNNSHTNQYGLEFTSILEWIAKNPDAVVENRTQEKYVDIDFDVFATPNEVSVKSKEAFEKMFKSARYLMKKYSETKAIDIIMKHVGDDGILKLKNFDRSISLIRLINKAESNELGDPLVKMIEKMYGFVDNFEHNSGFKISYDTYKVTLEQWTNEYIDSIGLSKRINTKYAFEKFQSAIVEMLMNIAKKQTSKTGITFSYNKLPDQDSSNVINRRSVDVLVQNMFGITNEVVSTSKTVKQKHVILTNQVF